jgi:GrpB-like predicted nucleotidyltransferase (UPF0157 family)
MSRVVELVEPDPAWSTMYDREANRIRDALGDQVRILEHVGSTSVAGLRAKPVIDIVLAVPDSSDEMSYRPRLEAAGFVLRLRETDWFQHRLFEGPDTDINLHVFSEGCEEVGRMIAFRDHLRDSPRDRDSYANAKQELASRDWVSVQDYADAKSPVIADIMVRAMGGRRS